jgi:isopentenyl phosphate kinase
MDRQWGAAICSTETLMLALADHLHSQEWRIRRILWLGETAGIYDAQGKTIERIDGSNADGILASLSGASGTDVTGGMRHRLQQALALARLDIPSWIVDGRTPGVLEDGLRGQAIGGTIVEA